MIVHARARRQAGLPRRFRKRSLRTLPASASGRAINWNGTAGAGTATGDRAKALSRILVKTWVLNLRAAREISFVNIFKLAI